MSGGTERACILGMNNILQKFHVSLGYCGEGYAEENEEWEKGDLSATNCTGKAFYGKKGYNSDEKHIFNW